VAVYRINKFNGIARIDGRVIDTIPSSLPVSVPVAVKK
jgi:hypothetical protein